MTDFGSRNGTYLNGKRLSVAKQESDPHELVHGSVLQVGGTKLLCHIHAGQETCGHCEPGLVQQTHVVAGKHISVTFLRVSFIQESIIFYFLISDFCV